MNRLILRRSLVHRIHRLLAGALAVMVAAAMVTALLGVSVEVRAKIGRDLQAYGANLLVLGRSAAGGGDLISKLPEDYLDESRLDALAGLPHSPVLYGVGQIAGKNVALVGVVPEKVRQVSPWWQVKGEWPVADGVLAGKTAAQSLGLQVGQRLDLTIGNQTRSVTVTGLLTTGAVEDEQLILPLRSLQELSQRTGLVNLVQVSSAGGAESPDALATRLQGQIPGATVRLLAQTAHAEERVLNKVQLLLALVAFTAVVTALLCLLSTMTASVLERRVEIGIFKALGASSGYVARLFQLEALVAAVMGGLMGWGLGLLLGQFISQAVFGLPLAVYWMTVPAALGVALVVALVAAWMPVHQAVSLQPATILRGE